MSWYTIEENDWYVVKYLRDDGDIREGARGKTMDAVEDSVAYWSSARGILAVWVERTQDIPFLTHLSVPSRDEYGNRK